MRLGRVVESLQATAANDDVLDDQASIAAMLWTMAQALDDAPRNRRTTSP